MSRTLRGAVLALIIAAAGPSSTRADWWCYSGYSSSYAYPTYYYFVAPSSCCVVQPAMAASPITGVRPGPASSPLAQPKSAPPSQTKEPPVSKKSVGPPTVIESKSMSFSDKATAGVEGADDNAVCRVGFWNITDRDVKLTVNGKAYTVSRNRNVTLPVGRTFAWQVEGGEPHTESVPQEELSHEIVIR